MSAARQPARTMWQPLFDDRSVDDVPITSATNGVHTPSWICPPMRELLDRHLGTDWPSRATDPRTWEPVARIPDDELWAARAQARTDMIDWARERAINDRLRRGEGLGYAEAVEQTRDRTPTCSPSALEVSGTSGMKAGLNGAPKESRNGS